MIFSLRSTANHTVEHVYSNVLKSNCEADLHRAQSTKCVCACARAYVSVCAHVCVCAVCVCVCVFNCSLPTNFFSLHPLLLIYIYSSEVCRLPQTHPKRHQQEVENRPKQQLPGQREWSVMSNTSRELKTHLYWPLLVKVGWDVLVDATAYVGGWGLVLRFIF